jgi:hypothetical protein
MVVEVRASGASSVGVDPAGVRPLVALPAADQLPTGRDLLLQALLHLPRIARPDGTIDIASARNEVDRLWAVRRADLAPLSSLAKPPRMPPKLGELDVRVVDRPDAASILEEFHYLRSAREDSVVVGATHKSRVVALCCISPLDLTPIAERLPIADPAEAAVVSRVFTFDWAPRNVVSYMLARAVASPAAIPRPVRMLVTYVNPNMGFSGASYKAANWLPLGIEKGTRYSYLDGRYITDRRVDCLPAQEQGLVEYSRMALRPLVLLCHLLDRRLRRAHPQGFGFAFERRSLSGERS